MSIWYHLLNSIFLPSDVLKPSPFKAYAHRCVAEAVSSPVKCKFRNGEIYLSTVGSKTKYINGFKSVKKAKCDYA